MLMVQALSEIRKRSIRNGHLISKLYYKGNVFDSRVRVHRCLCGIIDGIKNAEMTKINGVVITESQLFELNLVFLSLWHMRPRRLEKTGKKEGFRVRSLNCGQGEQGRSPSCALVLTCEVQGVTLTFRVSYTD